MGETHRSKSYHIAVVTFKPLSAPPPDKPPLFRSQNAVNSRYLKNIRTTKKSPERYPNTLKFQYCAWALFIKSVLKKPSKSCDSRSHAKSHCSLLAAAPLRARFPLHAAPPQIAGKPPIAIISAGKRPKHSPFIAQKSASILAASCGKVAQQNRQGDPPPCGQFDLRSSLPLAAARFCPL